MIQTDWGPVAPGTVIAAITAALERQRVSIAEIFNANVFKSQVSQPLIEQAMEDWKRKFSGKNPDESSANLERLTDTDDQNISNILVATLVGT